MVEIHFCFLCLIIGIVLGSATGLMGVPFDELKWNWAKTAWLIVLAMFVAILWLAATNVPYTK